MAILMDYNQIFISNIIQNPSIDEDLLRHMVLNTVRRYVTRFSKEFGKNLIVCCDDRYSWMRGFFKEYKANRKKNRRNSDLDWNMIFQSLEKIRDELKENFKYRVLLVETAEADDIIGVLCKYLHEQEPIVIVSSDKDFLQLQRYDGVQQYSPLRKEFIKCLDPPEFLKEHIIKGDVGDGIPNFMSDNDCLVIGKRQTPISKKKIQNWVKLNPTIFCDTFDLKRYKRNEVLIDLTKIPQDLQDIIVDLYENYEFPSVNILDYFIKNKLNFLFDRIGEF